MHISLRQGDTGPRQGDCGPPHGEHPPICTSVPAKGIPVPAKGIPVLHMGNGPSISLSSLFTVRNGRRLLPVSVIQGPGHSFINEDPTIFMEDLNTACARVTRPRQFPSVSLPTSDTTLPSQQEELSLADIQLLHNTIGNILTRQQQQLPVSSPSVPTSIPSSSSSDTLPSLEVGAKTCPVCQKLFREYSKCQAHYVMRHSRREGFQCKKCLKVLGSKVSLKFTNFTCIICQFASSRKAEMSKHMKSHDRWVQHPELRCKYCLQILHNKDGLHQHLKTCKHNSERPQQQYMCRNPGCGSVFSLLNKRNHHEKHRCHLLKKNLGRGGGQPQ